jgi:UDP-N-acetylmuramate--alanine ligase
MRTRAVHLVGIGGMHMSAIAQILLANGVRVSGSDQKRSDLTEKLRGLGADVRYGHAAENVGAVDLVVMTAAAREDNPELRAARERGILVISRAAMVARLMEGRTGICVAGTHGKTTTSSMIAWMLRQAGRDPSFLLGGESLDLGSNAHAGTGDEVVVEADEYARAFLEYHPKIAVITNVEADHLEYYGSVAAYEDAFRQFMGRVRPDGVIIACGDSPRLRSLTEEGYPARVETYGLGTGPHPPAPSPNPGRGGGTVNRGWTAHPLSQDWERGPGGEGQSPGPNVFDVSRDGEYVGRFALALPGRHMVENALAAVAAGHALGLGIEAMQSALASFRGARRRFELVGESRGITVVDDFAHHPTEVRVNLRAARERYAGRRVVLIFQPHTYSRTAYLLKEFIGCFTETDRLFILETFASRETSEAGLSAQDLAAVVKAPPCEYVRSAEDAADRLLAELRSGDVLLTMGAGDVDRVGRAVLERLRST